MIVALALLLLGAEDPRVPIAELQLEGRPAQALVRVETALRDEPDAAGKLGFHYLRGHLLEQLERRDAAQRAFSQAMHALPQLTSYSRYRLALNQFRLNHPEVAAGLLAQVLTDRPPQPLARPATELLVRALEAGGDCRLLDQMDSWRLTPDARRGLRLASADCMMRAGRRDEARATLVSLLEEEVGDEPARAAAERLNRLMNTSDPNPPSRMVGMAFYRHRQFSLSVFHLSRGLGNPASWQTDLRDEEDFEVLYALARSNFWRRDYIQAASQFGQLAAATTDPEEKARALYQQGRAWELFGNWDNAADSYKRAYLAEPAGTWADAGLMSALRVEWRTGDEVTALQLYEELASRRSWQPMLNRASFFLAASDIVRGRGDRARGWLARTVYDRDDSTVELSYWQGRLAELTDPREAVDRYIATAVEDAYHPLARAALRRLAEPPLAEAALTRALRLASSSRTNDLYGAWLVLGESRAEGAAALGRLESRLAGDAKARTYLEIAAQPPAEWPIWEARLTQPEELLLALGVWDQGASVVLKHFPATDPSLAFTGGRILAHAEASRPSIYIGEILHKRMPAQLPSALAPHALRQLLYPLPYRDLIVRESERWGIDPLLLAALIREESKFDPRAVSGASARGLAQFVLPTANRLAQQIGIENLRARDLHSPSVSIALGAAYMAELASQFGNGAHLVLAAYNAGEDQTRVWRSYCYSTEPEEFFSKVGFPQTRSYLRKVLTSREQYAQLYGE